MLTRVARKQPCVVAIDRRRRRIDARVASDGEHASLFVDGDSRADELFSLDPIEPDDDAGAVLREVVPLLEIDQILLLRTKIVRANALPFRIADARAVVAH